MAEKKSEGGLSRFRKIQEAGVSARLFSWKTLQSEAKAAEIDYVKVAKAYSLAKQKNDAFETEIAGLTEKINKETEKSAEIAQQLEELTAAHENLKRNYEADTKNWSEEVTSKESQASCSITERDSLRKQLTEKEELISSLQKQLDLLKAEAEAKSRLEKAFEEKNEQLDTTSGKYHTLSSEYTALVHEKNELIEKYEFEINGLKLAHTQEIDKLNAEFAEKSRLYLPTIHELTRDVDSWKYQRECDLTEIHRLRTILDRTEKELEVVKAELEEQNGIKREMLAQINRAGFAFTKAESDTHAREEKMKAEYNSLKDAYEKLQKQNGLLKADLTHERGVLSTYSEITTEITEDWKKHPEVALEKLTAAVKSSPEKTTNGYFVKISGEKVLYGIFSPKSYEELCSAESMVKKAAKNLVDLSASEKSRKESYLIVPDECMMYLTKTLHASTKGSVEVITASQIPASIRNVSRFIVCEKSGQ